MFSKEELIQDLCQNMYCRLGVSQIHGVGVFAIRDIPVGSNPFRGLRTTNDHWVEIPAEEIFQNPDIPEPVKTLVRDFYVIEGGVIFSPWHGLNEINIPYFVNHSKTPNLREEDLEFYALRDIAAGEELTIDYGTYSDDWRDSKAGT